MKVILLFFIPVVFISCAKHKEVPEQPDLTGCRDTLFTFEKDILPIMTLNCNFELCHGESGLGSYDFTQYAVVVGRIHAGTLQYRMDLPQDDPQHMPEGMKLNKCDYNIIKAWIQQGYPEK